MLQYVFTSAQGRFPIPEGESRIGSDSVCPVCIQGEGILPIHAYLKAEDGKLLIRPSSDKAALVIDGKAVDGPRTIGKGQSVFIGPLELTVELQGAPARHLWGRKWFRRSAYGLGGVGLLVLLAVLLRLFWFNDHWWKAQLTKQIAELLQRDETEIDNVEVHLLDGTIRMEGLRVPNKNKEIFADEPDLLRIQEVRVRLDPWPFLRSWGREWRAASLTVVRPELLLERTELNGRSAWNVDDLYERLLKRPSTPGVKLQALELNVAIENGRLRLRDSYTEVGESSLEGIEFTLAQKGLGAPAQFRIRARTQSGDEPDGSLDLTGSCRLVSAAGEIAPKDLREGRVDLTLQGCDLGRVCRHLQWEFPVHAYGKELKVVPAKPISGDFQLRFQDLKRYRISARFDSQSLVSVLEKGHEPIGHIPTSLALELTYDTREKTATEMTVDLRSASSLKALHEKGQKKIVVFKAAGTRNPGGDYSFKVDLDTSLNDLFATDVGKRLALEGRLRGRLTAHAEIVHGQTQSQIEARAALSKDAQVLVPNPANPKAPGQWQPLKFLSQLYATARPNKNGRIADVKVDEFYVKADSFEAKSIQPHAELKSLDDLERLSVLAKFKLNLKGREFYTEFRPILGLLGFERPIEEIFDLEVKVSSDAAGPGKGAGTRRISVGVQGSAARQWRRELPEPVPLLAILDYFPEEWSRGLKKPGAPAAKTARPYLKLTLQVGNERTPPFVRLDDVALYRNGRHQTLSVQSLRVASDLDALRERFHPYLQRLATWLDLQDLYKQYRFKGYLSESGRVTVQRGVKPAASGPPAAPQPLDVKFALSFSGKDLIASGPVPGTPRPGSPNPRWYWTEPKPHVSVQGRYRFTPAPNKEEAPFQRLDLEKLNVKGRVGDFKLSSKDVDLWLLKELAAGKKIPGKVWSDGLEAFRFRGTVAPPAFEFLRRVAQLPEKPACGGTLKLNLDYARQDDRLGLKELVFEDAGAPEPFWLKELNATAELRKVRAFFLREATPGSLLLGHLGDHLVIRALTLEAPAFVQWLKDFPAQAKTLSFPPALVKALLEKKTVPEGNWTVRDLVLYPAPKQERTWNVVGRFRNDLTCALPPLLKGEAGSPGRLVFRGPWRIEKEETASIALQEDNRSFSVQLPGINLDRAEIALKGWLPSPSPKRFWDYHKAPGQPLRLVVEGGSRSPGKGPQDTIYLMEAVHLKGGPLELNAGNLKATTKRDPKTDQERLETLQLSRAELKGGPWPCTLEKLAFDRAKDRVAGQFKTPSLDLAWAERLRQRVPGLTIGGRMDGVSFTYAGSFKRLNGFALSPGKDTFRLGGQLKDVQLFGRAGPNEQLWIRLNGEGVVTASALRCKKLAVAIAHDQAAQRVIHLIHADGFHAAARDPKENWWRAWKRKAPNGNPQPFVALKLPLKFKQGKPFDLTALAGVARTLQKCLDAGKAGPPAPPGSNPYQTLAGMWIEGSLDADSMRLGGLQTGPLKIPSFTLKEMKAAAPLVQGTLLSGPWTLTDTKLDLGAATVETPLHVQFESRIKGRDAGLKQLLALAKVRETQGGYRYDGKLDLEGVLKGTGFQKKDRLTWNGAFEVLLKDLVAVQTKAPPRPKNPSLFSSFARNLLPGLKQALFRFAGKKAVGIPDLAKNNPLLSPASSYLDATMFMSQLYMTRLGIDTRRLEFEDARVALNIVNGTLEIPRSTLKGKGPTAGVQVAFRGRIRLSNGAFIKPFEVFVTKLPELAQEHLSLSRWPKEQKERFLADLSEGRLALRISGSLSHPAYKLPYDKLYRYAMLATMNRPALTSGQDLEGGLQHFRNTWGGTEQGTDAAGDLFELWGIPLPGTALAQNLGSSIIQGLPGISPLLQNLFSRKETLTPRQALRRMAKPSAPRQAPPKRPRTPKRRPAPKRRKPEPAPSVPLRKEEPPPKAPRGKEPLPPAPPAPPTLPVPPAPRTSVPTPEKPKPPGVKKPTPPAPPPPSPPSPLAPYRDVFKLLDELRRKAAGL